MTETAKVCTNSVPAWGGEPWTRFADPVLATEAFLGTSAHSMNAGLKDVVGWESMTLTDAAQAVQRSGFPDAYAKWESSAKKIVQVTDREVCAVHLRPH